MNGFLFPTIGLDCFLSWQREATRDAEHLLQLWIDAVRTTEHWMLIGNDTLRKWSQLTELPKAF